MPGEREHEGDFRPHHAGADDSDFVEWRQSVFPWRRAPADSQHIIDNNIVGQYCYLDRADKLAYAGIIL
jgi:hypothetical protein